MSAMDCGEVRHLLGVYVIGSIEPAERSRVDAHLSTCPACRDELAGLAGLPALLGRVDEAQIAEVLDPPKASLESLLAAAAARRPGRLRQWAPRLAAAAVLLVLGGVAGMAVEDPRSVPAPGSSPPVQPAAEQVTATDPRTHVTAQVGMDGKAWGTAVVVRLKGAPPGSRCQLMAVGRDGRRDIAAGWQVVYTGFANFSGSTMIKRDQLQGFEIRTVDGRMLLNIAASPP